MEQAANENEKRGVAEHSLDVALGDKAEYVELVERERDEARARVNTLMDGMKSIKCPADENPDHDALHCMRCWCYAMMSDKLVDKVV